MHSLFLLETPGTSAAWSLDISICFLEEIASHTAIFDQCRFGLRGPSGLLHRKTARIETGSPCIAKRLDGKRCLKDHEHELIIGGKHVSGPAGHYPAQLAKEIVLGIEEEFDVSMRIHDVLAVDDVEDEGD